MHFTTNRDHLSAALRKCAEVAHKQTMPILGSVLLRVSGDTLHLSATDLDMGVACQVKVEAGEDGAACFPAKHLLAVIEACRELEVNFGVDKGVQATIKSGKSRFRVAGLDAREFPVAPPVEGTQIVVAEASLSRMIKAVQCCVSTNPNRYILNAIYFKPQPDQLLLVATDGRRLGKIFADATCADGPGFVLPSAAVKHLSRTLGFDKDCTISFGERNVTFECSLGRFWTKLVEGTFPNFNQVIPKYDMLPIKIERELLAECVGRATVATFADDKHDPSVTLKFSGGELECTATTTAKGESFDSLAVEYGGDVSICLNPGFLLPILAGLTDDSVGVAFKDELSPLLVTGIAFLAVIMPQRMK